MSILKIFALDSDDPRFDAVFVSNYALLNVVDELRRVPGVGDVQIFGSKDYSMRVWLRPDVLAQAGADARRRRRRRSASRTRSSPPAAIGEEPMDADSGLHLHRHHPGPARVEPEEFGRIVHPHRRPGGGITRLEDVARIELGSRAYDFSSTRNGKPTVPIGVFLQPGANALEVGAAVEARMAELSQRFPAGLDYSVAVRHHDATSRCRSARC